MVERYDGRERLARELAGAARRAARELAALPDAPHHLMLLVGAVAYFASTPDAQREPTRTLLAPLQAELEPLAAPTIAYVRAWRALKRARPGGERR